jgi:hypothetical protein
LRAQFNIILCEVEDRYRSDRVYFFRVLVMILFNAVSPSLSAQTSEAWASEPKYVAYVYGQPLSSDDIIHVLQLLQTGQFDSELNVSKFKPGSSAWIYIPRCVLAVDTLRKHLLTGYHDQMDVYRRIKGQWFRCKSIGKYVDYTDKTSDERAYIKLYDELPSDSTFAFIIACHKRNNYFFTNLQADLKSQPELTNWRTEQREIFGNVQKIMLPFLGIALASVILLIVRFTLSRDWAYFFLTISYSLTFSFCMLLYMLFPVYWGDRPVVDPLVAVHLIHFLIFLSIAFLSVSMRFFYPQGKFVKRNNRVTNSLAVVSTLVAVSTFVSSLLTEKYYLINNVSMIVATLITTAYGMHLFAIRKDIKNAFKIVVLGLVLMMAFVDLGFFLVLIENNWNIGYEVLQGFPMMIGLAIMIIFTISAFSKREHQALQESIDLKSRVFEAEMAVVQRSLNPHFIFNCLNLIDSFLYTKSNESARKVLYDFSDLLRLVIDKSPNALITLSEELEMLRLYLDLEQSRSNNSFRYNIHIDSAIKSGLILLPPLIIQPIVENAVKHGILNRKSPGGLVDISVRSEDMDVIIIDVIDNGVGLDVTHEMHRNTYHSRSHVGIQLTRKRLAIISEIYKSASILNITNRRDEAGTIATIQLPNITSSNYNDSIHY